jgi:hypothetical protein
VTPKSACAEAPSPSCDGPRRALVPDRRGDPSPVSNVYSYPKLGAALSKRYRQRPTIPGLERWSRPVIPALCPTVKLNVNVATSERMPRVVSQSPPSHWPVLPPCQLPLRPPRVLLPAGRQSRSMKPEAPPRKMLNTDNLNRHRRRIKQTPSVAGSGGFGGRWYVALPVLPTESHPACELSRCRW